MASIVPLGRSFAWTGTTTRRPSLGCTRIKWLPVWWSSTNPCFFRMRTSLRGVNEGGLGTGWFRRGTDVDAGGEALVIGGDGFAVFFETCQIALDRIDGHPPRLAQRTAPRNTSGKCGDEYGVAAFWFRPENDLIAHGPKVREHATLFKQYASS